jgi:anaerobic dimethyl sulfoxide reductase subunit B (iron-sulfur subunit)
MNKEYIIRFDADKCIQCHGCETACKTWRNLPHGMNFRRVFNIWDGHYPEVKSSSLSLACMQCVEPACMEVCPKNAISKRQSDGRVLVDADLCIGCRACAKACPFGVPQFDQDKIMHKCDLCFNTPSSSGEPPCVATCPGNALRLEEIPQADKKNQESDVATLLQRAGLVTGKKRKRKANSK